jgi:hypothetical protein
MSRKNVRRRKEERALHKFAIWLRRDFAVICDRDVPLEHGCRVAFIQHNLGWRMGALLTKSPAGARRLRIVLENQPKKVGPIVHVSKENVVRVIGRYQVLATDGELRGSQTSGSD